MAKKRKRSAAVEASEFPWQKVENVGLLAPSKASSTSQSQGQDDDDFDNAENNHYDEPSSSVYRSAERDLEADPNEGVGMFFGLEVLDGSQYDVVEAEGFKRIVPKTESSQKQGDKGKGKKKDSKASKNKEDEKKEPKASKSKEDSSSQDEGVAESKSDKETDEETNGTKKKKKRKKKKKKKSADGGGSASDSKGANEGESNAAKAKEPKDDQTATATTDDSGEIDPKVESLQTSWLTATGGVTLQERVCKSLLEQDFWNPTPIQAASLPAAILGRRNIVGAAPTGSGKTLAYLLPIVEFLLQQREPSYEERRIQALILAPTRELALQVQGECNKLLKGKCGILVGGLATQKQERVLRKNRPPIIIATPGRLWEMISSRDHDHLNDLSQISFLVIDECDRMTEQGSFPQLHSILDAVEKANPMDEGDDEDDEESEEDDDDDVHRMRALPGIKGEAKVVMLSPELLAMMEKQKDGGGTSAHEPIEMDDEEFEVGQQEAGENMVDEEEDMILPVQRPVQRQTFVYSATLTLPPSASYIPSRNKGKRMFKLKGVEGAIEEILDKARARGQTKVIDLSNSKKQAKFNEKILESKERSRGDTSKNDDSAPRRTFNLPPGLKLQEIQCTQLHKDSHLYAYLVTTREGSSGPCLIFCNSIKGVKRVANTLKELGLPVRMLHAQLQQRARFRAVESLQGDSRAIVVATDVAARGLDIPNVATVVHYDVARKVDGFVHRAGRTARGMGEKAVGSSLSLISPAEDKAHAKIAGELNATFYRVNLDSRLLTAAQERANLASKIIAVEKVEGMAQRDNNWFVKAAEDAGLEIDEDMLDDGLAGGNLKEQQQLREAQRAKGLLQKLLAEPMVKQRYGKFLSSHTASSKPEVAPYVVKPQSNRSKKRRRKGK